MTTNEIVQELRKRAEMFRAEPLWALMREAANRLEELDERVSIMTEGKDDN